MQSYFKIIKVETGFLSESFEIISVDSDTIIIWQDLRIFVSFKSQNIPKHLNNYLSYFSEEHQQMIKHKYPYIQEEPKIDAQSRFTIICVSTSIHKIQLKPNNSICMIQNGVTIHINDINGTLFIKADNDFEIYKKDGTIAMYPDFIINESLAVIFSQFNLYLCVVEHNKEKIIPFLRQYENHLTPEQQKQFKIKINQGIDNLSLYQMTNTEKSALAKEQKLQKLAKAQIDNAVEEQAQQKIYIVEEEQQETKRQNIKNDVAQLKNLQEKVLNFSDSEIDEVQETQIQSKTKQSVETSESDVVLEEEVMQKQSHVSELIDVDDSIKTDHIQYIVPLKDVEQFVDELLTNENTMFIDSSQSIIDTQQNIFSNCKDNEQESINAVYVCLDTQSKFYANPYILFGVYHCIPIVTQIDKKSLQLKYRTKHKRIQFGLYSDLKMKNMKPSAKPKICEEMQLLKAIEISMASINHMQLFVTQATVQKHFKLIEKIHGWEYVHKWADLDFNYKVWCLEDLASFIFLDQE
ncbi:Hypothetical_protein [Hexamita inflata]|uniref:Hypothetical_protein n=1 Tax=Hexamita inflata TaxID=28002 RepID=A0AA86PWF5_9EUKA|nr:Hypothetical protein HINF_LOCUS33913 [Hexamita inflata]